MAFASLRTVANRATWYPFSRTEIVWIETRDFFDSCACVRIA